MPLPIHAYPRLLRGMVWIGAIMACGHATGADDSHKVAFFESRIRPVLVARCYGCHSVEAEAKGKLKGGLHLDSREGLKTGGDSGPAIVAGQPGKSLLIQAIRRIKPDLAMPASGDPLPAAVIADFERWIAEGAADPRAGLAPVVKKRGMSVEEGRTFWSLVAPRPPGPIREIARHRAEAGDSDIDLLVAVQREKQRLTPVAPADARSLVRRLSFDLIGLPPTPAEVEDFVREHRQTPGTALERLVTRLLASPHFGERWGRHWLDLARYADSNGRDRNIINHHAWRYRDYVIASLNRDKPYDQFIREQIAGDLLPAASAAQRDEQRIATGFLALGAKAFEEVKPEVFRMDVIDEQIEVISRSVLGLSIGCARCHDHKFDPISTADYYALAGILRSTAPLYGWGPRGIKATAHHHTEWQPIGPESAQRAPTALAYYRRLDAEILALHTARSDRYRVVRRLSSAKLEGAKAGGDRTKLAGEIRQMEAEIQGWDPKIRALEVAVEALKDAAPPEPDWAMAARDRERIENCRIHIRGETTNLGPAVPRGMPEVIALPHVSAPGPKESGRLQLAQWLTDRGNPLTARVCVNRVWQKLFGRALVTTPDDFGVNGARPSHPELLDHLALRFMDSGWSVKALIRELVLTRTYQLSTDADAANLGRDPDNVFLWRMAPRPLEAEVLRDAILAVSGSLDCQPPARQFLQRYHPRRDAELFTFKPFVTPADLVTQHRSVYLPVIRGALPEIYQIFDFAAPERPVAQREESVVPAQALFLMNNPWIIEQADMTAKRFCDDPGSGTAEQITRLYLLAFARAPLPDETRQTLAFLQGDDTQRPETAAAAATRWSSLCQSIFAAAEFRVLR